MIGKLFQAERTAGVSKEFCSDSSDLCCAAASKIEAGMLDGTFCHSTTTPFTSCLGISMMRKQLQDVQFARLKGSHQMVITYVWR